MPLKGKYLRVTIHKVSRCGIMATQLLAVLTTVHHPLKCGIVVYLVNLRHPFHSIPLDECFVSQLERCSYLSLHELILNTRSSRRSSSVESPFVVIVLDEDLASKDVKIVLSQQINTSRRQLDLGAHAISLCPLCLLTSRLESRDEILV